MEKLFFKIVLKTDKIHKDGTATIYNRIGLNGKYKYFSTGIRANPKNWNDKARKIKSTDLDYIFKNNIIETKHNQLKQIYQQLIKENKQITFELLNNVINNEKSEKICFYELIANEIKNRSFASETKRTYTSQLTKLKHFSPEIDIHNINFEFVQAYKAYMINNLGNKPNTYFKSLSMLKTFVNWIIEKNIIINNPFDKIPIKRVNGNRSFLSLTELNILENLYHTKQLAPEKLNVLNYFLFSCYTGLRFSDIHNLRKKDFYTEIVDNLNNFWLAIDMHKTGIPVNIPVIPKALKLISLDNKILNEKVLKVHCNQYTNRQLKEIMLIAGINKNITYHSSRHTFATVGIELGMPIEVISKILGHTTIKTTQIYARITSQLKYNQMMKLN